MVTPVPRGVSCEPATSCCSLSNQRVGRQTSAHSERERGREREVERGGGGFSGSRVCARVQSSCLRSRSPSSPEAQQPKSRESCRRRSWRYRDVLVLEYQGGEVRSSRRGFVYPVCGTQGGLSVGSKGAHGERGVLSCLGTWDFPDLLPRRWWLRAGGRPADRRTGLGGGWLFYSRERGALFPAWIHSPGGWGGEEEDHGAEAGGEYRSIYPSIRLSVYRLQLGLRACVCV